MRMIQKLRADSRNSCLLRPTFIGSKFFLATLAIFKIHGVRLFTHFSIPIQAKTIRYGTPIMSSIFGSHHALFSQGDGLIKQPIAPKHPPTIEIVAAGFLRLIQEQTVILLKAITPAARVKSRHAMNQRKCDPISSRERAISIFLPYDRRNLAEIALGKDGEEVGL